MPEISLFFNSFKIHSNKLCIYFSVVPKRYRSYPDLLHHICINETKRHTPERFFDIVE